MKCSFSKYRICYKMCTRPRAITKSTSSCYVTYLDTDQAVSASDEHNWNLLFMGARTELISTKYGTIWSVLYYLSLKLTFKKQFSYFTFSYFTWENKHWSHFSKNFINLSNNFSFHKNEIVKHVKNCKNLWKLFRKQLDCLYPNLWQQE